MLIAGLTAVLTLVAASMAAFTFAHVGSSGASCCSTISCSGLMFPAATAVLPLFIQIRDFGLLDTYWGVILPESGVRTGDEHPAVPRILPRRAEGDLFEAAFVDGCGYIRFFFSMTLPLSRPILATVGDHSAFVRSWNNYLLPLIMLDSDAEISLAARHHGATRASTAPSGSSCWPSSRLTILPAVIVFFAAQKHIVAGLTAGAVKG